jgi:peptidyl-prolyl cis-trans isomerase C
VGALPGLSGRGKTGAMLRLRVPTSFVPNGRALIAAGCLAALPSALWPASRVGAQPDAAVAAPDAQRRATPVIHGDGVAITVGDLEDAIAQQPPGLRERFRDPAEQKSLVESLLKLALMSREAERRGFGKDMAVRHTAKDGAIQALVRSEVDEKVTPQSVSDVELSEYYAAHPAEFQRPAERRASYVKLSTREEAEAALGEAKAADLRRFGELAKERSTDAETKLRGGDLGYFVEHPDDAGAGLGSIEPALRSAVFALKTPGDTSPEPIAVDGGFAIVRYTGERPALHADLAAASAGIRNRLWREKRSAAVNALIEGIRTREKPEVFRDRVDLIKFDDMDHAALGYSPDPKRAAKADGGAAKP